MPRKKNKLCPDCGKKLSNNDHKRCQNCYYKTINGEGNPNWRGGESLKPDYGKNKYKKNKNKILREMRLKNKIKICPECGRIMWNRSNLCIKCRVNEKTYNWKGNKVGLSALHMWVKRRKLKPLNCENCGKKTIKLDLANISQEYKRAINDFKWLCRKCHIEYDGILNNLHKNLNKYSEDEIKFIKENYGKILAEDIAKALNRTANGIRQKAIGLDLKSKLTNANAHLVQGSGGKK